MSNQRDGQGNSEKLPPCPPSILRNLSTKQKHRCRPVLRWAYHPNLKTVVSYWNLRHVKGDCYLEAGQNIETCKLTFTILRGYIFSEFRRTLVSWILGTWILKTKKKRYQFTVYSGGIEFLGRFELLNSLLFATFFPDFWCVLYDESMPLLWKKLQGMIIPYHLYGPTRAVMQSDWLPLHSPPNGWSVPGPGSRTPIRAWGWAPNPNVWHLERAEMKNHKVKWGVILRFGFPVESFVAQDAR